MSTLMVELFNKVKCLFLRLYFLYELNTQISICEPWEKAFCNALLSSIVIIMLYGLIYVPAHWRIILTFLTSTNWTTVLSSADDDFL